MIKIFICEDNKEQKEKFKDIISNIIMIENYDMEIELVTDDPYIVLDKLKNNTVTGLYFLDVDLRSSINGIQLAEQIRKYDPRGFIVFITTHAEMSYLTFMYKVEAMDYIIKDNYKNIGDRIKACIKNALDKYKIKSSELQKVFSVKLDDRIINVDFNDIIFFETSTTIHKVILNCTNRQVEFYSNMKEVYKMLDERFCRCHTSFIINKDKIKEIDKKNRIIYMITGDECLASTRGIKKLLG
ncbi:LytR/AlgR family response regulator transcription factor [Clostridium bornimense]|nr:LytTR family DNA-binding domain-containing protein [Clostridium bornimense]